MNSREDLLYRIQLGQGYLKRAEEDAPAQKWDASLANAQEAVENAGKAILGLFQPVPKTHDVIDELMDLLQKRKFSESIRKLIVDGLDSFREMGMETHVRATYGDEKARIPPWILIKEPEAREGLEKARRAVALAEAIYLEMTTPKDKSK